MVEEGLSTIWCEKRIIDGWDISFVKWSGGWWDDGMQLLQRLWSREVRTVPSRPSPHLLGHHVNIAATVKEVGTSWMGGFMSKPWNLECCQKEMVRWSQPAAHSRRWRWRGPSCQRRTRRWRRQFLESLKPLLVGSCLRLNSSCSSTALPNAGQVLIYILQISSFLWIVDL